MLLEAVVEVAEHDECDTQHDEAEYPAQRIKAHHVHADDVESGYRQPDKARVAVESVLADQAQAEDEKGQQCPCHRDSLSVVVCGHVETGCDQ